VKWSLATRWTAFRADRIAVLIGGIVRGEASAEVRAGRGRNGHGSDLVRRVFNPGSAGVIAVIDFATVTGQRVRFESQFGRCPRVIVWAKRLRSDTIQPIPQRLRSIRQPQTGSYQDARLRWVSVSRYGRGIRDNGNPGPGRADAELNRFGASHWSPPSRSG